MEYSKGYIYLIAFLVLTNIIGGYATNNTLLLYSTTTDIRITNTTRSNNQKYTVLIRNFTEGPAIDYHYEDKKICWTDVGLESIQCADYDGIEAKNKVDVISNGIGSPVGLACDWFTRKLYWLDSDTRRIEVVTMDGKFRKVLFWNEIDQPRAIALAPMKGLMFWTDWGETQKIERAGMDGDPSTRKIIVSTNIVWPNGLTVDYEAELIYWFDTKLNFMEVMTFDGMNRTTILKSKFEYPFALTMFKTKLFWTDWKTWAIHYYDRSTNESKQLINYIDSVPMYVQIYDSQRQPKHPHPCQKDNGGCSHLCLLSPNAPGYSCACPAGIKLVNNLTCAQGPEELLLLARRTDICVIYLDSLDYSYKTLPLNNVTYSIAVDYDPVENNIYWSDDEVKKIQKANLDGTHQEDVVFNEINHPDGIAIDWASRNLYWTDAGTDRVEVCTLGKIGKKYRRAIISDNLVDPRGIAVAPELGWLFWSDWYEKKPKIERANLDGSEREAIVFENLGWPNGITLDLSRRKLYWCDAKTDKIEYSNMDGSDRQVLISDNLPHVFGFTLMGDYLYWTDWQGRTIERAHKETGGQREVILEQMANVMGLKSINLRNRVRKNACSTNNGGCLQFCFYRHNKTKICACELGYELTKDQKTCVKASTFLLYSREKKLGIIGIENENNEIDIPIGGINHASSIDYDDTKRIYWSDSASRLIMRAFIDGSEPEKVLDFGLASPESIAIDWLGLNIYWTDSLAHRIEVARLMGSSRRTLLWEGKVYDPHSIVLDPPNGYMYWSEWGASKSIKRAEMDGSRPHQLITTGGYASHLSLDHEKRRLYWIETNLAAILSSDLNGNDVRDIVRDNIDTHRPVGFTLFKDVIYWSDNMTGEILRTSIDGSNRHVVHKNTYHITDLLVYHAKNRGSNQCATSNAGCRHLCLAVPSEDSVKYRCACPTHYTLTADGECEAPKQFMIYSQKNMTVRLLPSPTECLEVVLPIQGLKGVKAIDFDPVKAFLYWIEGKTQSIKRAEGDGSGKTQSSKKADGGGPLVPIVVHGNKEVQPFDIAVDSIGRLLFWTCASKDVINVTRLDSDIPASIPFGVVVQKENEKPRLLAIHPTKRLLFYTDVGPARQLIRTRLDGSQRFVITRNADISAIAVDPENDWIVWTQEKSIYTSNIEGENQHVLVNESRTPITQLTVLKGWLYWIDRESSQLQRVELLSGNFRSSLSLQASHIVDIISVTETNLNDSCSQQNKKCSHLCILNGTSAACACPKGNVLNEDKRTCSTLQDCGPAQFTCASLPAGQQQNCIPRSWRCDRQKDCSDGSDEFNCPECLISQFKCKDGTCISLTNKCDGIPHCTDRSDEENCCRDGFQCPNTEVCLPMHVICDKTDHCADGADEHPSVCSSSTSKLKTSADGIVFIIIGVSAGFLFLAVCFYCLVKKRFKTNEEIHDHSEDSLSPMQPKPLVKMAKIRRGIPDVVRIAMLTGSETSYDRNHITGASSSTNESSLTCYPREPLNPPPSPATTRGSSPSSRHRQHRHYRTIYQPPPPTPCSTDVCDESDYNYPTRSRYDTGPFPPPPTPRSHCHSESCPPSPSSRSSTYFNPLPPPPSPVASPLRGYDS